LVREVHLKLPCRVKEITNFNNIDFCFCFLITQMMTKKIEISYNEAFQEMEVILEKIENEELDIDQLSSSLIRVSHLMKLCRDKLRKTETEVEKILKEMEED